MDGSELLELGKDVDCKGDEMHWKTRFPAVFETLTFHYMYWLIDD